MAKKKAESDAPAEAMAPAETISKSEAVRRALAEGVDSPTDGVAYIRDKFGLEMTNGQFSTVKFQENKKKGSAPGKRGRKPAASAAAAPARTVHGIPNVAGPLTTIKHLVETLGVDQVKEIAEIFRK